jgi:hypothetical protein
MFTMTLILLCLFVVFPVGLFFGIRWLAFRYLPQEKRVHHRMLAITPSGFALCGCLLVALLLLFSAPQLQPNGPLGTFLRQPGGMVAGILLIMVSCTIAERILRKLGHPTTRVRNDRDV